MQIEKVSRLHTDFLADRYGPMHVKLVFQDDYKRIVDINDGLEITRCHAVTWWEKGLRLKEKIRAPLEEIMSGGSMGIVFRSHGFEISKPKVAEGVVMIPRWLQQRFEVETNLAYAQMYWFVAQNNRERFNVGMIAEVDTPDFVKPSCGRGWVWEYDVYLHTAIGRVADLENLLRG